MIVCFEGTPGSGKTYDAVRKIIANLKAGRVVYTNIEGFQNTEKREFIRQMHDIDELTLSLNLIYLNPEQVTSFYKIVRNGSIIVIDEAHKFFSNRNWQSVENNEMSKWASTHRHFGFDVIFISQNVEKIDSHARGLFEWTYRYRKVNFFGSAVKNKYIVYAFSGDDSAGRPLSKKIHTYDPVVFLCYESYASKDITEHKIMTHANILKHPVFYFIPVLIIIFVVLFFQSGFATGNLIPGSRKDEKISNVQTPVISKPSLSTRRIVVQEYSYDDLIKMRNKPLSNSSVSSVVSVPSLTSKKVGSVSLYSSSGDEIYTKDILQPVVNVKGNEIFNTIPRNSSINLSNKSNPDVITSSRFNPKQNIVPYQKLKH